MILCSYRSCAGLDQSSIDFEVIPRAEITLRTTVRVVDASAFPFLVPGPAPQAAVCKLYHLPVLLLRRN